MRDNQLHTTLFGIIFCMWLVLTLASLGVTGFIVWAAYKLLVHFGVV